MSHRIKQRVGLGIVTAAALSGGVAVSAPSGVRLGPVQTVCADTSGVEPGDVAMVNLTLIDGSGPGFVTAHNADTDPFGVSSVNTTGAAGAVPNLTATVVDENRQVCVTSSPSMSSHIALDVVGVVDHSVFSPQAGGALRLLDTRDAGSGQPVAPGATTCVGVPGGAAGDVAFINTTVTQPNGPGYITVHDSSNANPGATSSLNFVEGDTLANLTMTVLSADLRVCATASEFSSTHVILDLVGTLDGAAFDRPGLFPARILDTRRTFGPTGGAPVPAGTTRCAALPGAAEGAGVIANVTVTEPDGLGYATVHRPGGDPTATSTHNFREFQTIANLTATELGNDGRLCVSPSALSSAHFVVDYIGSIAADAFSAPDGGAERILDTRDQDVLPGRYGTAALRFGSCDELLTSLKASRLAQIDQWVELYGDFGQPVFLPATNGNGPVAGVDFSTTNTQDADVDEGDLVETDGVYLYDATQPNDGGTSVRIIDIASASEVARVPLPGDYPEIILHNGRILATTSGYSTDFDFTQTNVTKIDVNDPTNPTIIDQYGLDGTRRAMRSVDGNVHIVLRSDRSPDGFDVYWGSQSADEAKAAVEASTIDDWLPRVFELGDDSYVGAERAIRCDNLGLPNLDAGTGITWVARDDLASGPGFDGGAGVIANAGQVEVMANVRNLYVATTAYDDFGGFWNDTAVTAIHMFEMSGDGPTAYRATTELPGRLLNQFAMAEHDGVLRVALTAGWWNESESAVFALRRSGSTFERLSMVTGLGRGERIFAVRHIGSTSYVVTFRETDPLYVVDFDDPLRPQLAGELKIPGFSDYLHPVGDGLLLGVGQDAVPSGVPTGAQLSLFDVSDPSDPRRIDTLDVGGPYRMEDHREFLFWSQTGTIATPATDEFYRGFTNVAELDGRRLRQVGRFGSCSPQRTMVVGSELITIGSSSVTFAAIDDLAVRATIGECGDEPSITLPGPTL